jgi:hypothetical protein
LLEPICRERHDEIKRANKLLAIQSLAGKEGVVPDESGEIFVGRSRQRSRRSFFFVSMTNPSFLDSQYLAKITRTLCDIDVIFPAPTTTVL